MNILDILLGKVSYIDEFEWPTAPDPLNWLKTTSWKAYDVNSLYPTVIIPPSTDSTMEELE